jgi:acyl carrier protein
MYGRTALVEPRSITDSIATRVKQVIVSVLGIDLDPMEIDDHLSLYSEKISLDSLTLLHVITELERELACKIDDEALMRADLISVGSLIELMRDQLDAIPDADGKAAAERRGQEG